MIGTSCLYINYYNINIINNKMFKYVLGSIFIAGGVKLYTYYEKKREQERELYDNYEKREQEREWYDNFVKESSKKIIDFLNTLEKENEKEIEKQQN